MSIVRYRQWPATAVFQREASALAAPLLRAINAANSGTWQPAVDIREEQTQFVLYADIPGVDPQSIELEMEKGVLQLKGERRATAAAEEGRLSHSERSAGTFQRRFALPDSADAEGITAHSGHGVLEVRIPKRTDAGPRRIPVAFATAQPA